MAEQGQTPAGAVHAPERRRAASLSLVLGAAVFGGKIAAYGLTGSTAVLSDALESVVNVAAAALLAYSIAVAARPADRSHPYGHGKVEFFSAGVEGALIAVAAGVILFEAVRELFRGWEPQRLDLGLGIVAAMAVVNAALGGYLIRVGRRTQSLALVADGRHLLTDVATSAAVVLGLLAVRFTGWWALDPLVAIAVALNIMRTGASLLREAVGGLMDEADSSLLATLSRALEANRRPWWIDVHSLRAWRSGAVSHVDLHLVVPRYYDVERLHRVDEEISAAAAEAGADANEVIIHFDPCRPRQCPECPVDPCPVRGAPFRKRDPLSLERTTRGDELLETGLPIRPPEE